MSITTFYGQNYRSTQHITPHHTPPPSRSINMDNMDDPVANQFIANRARGWRRQRRHFRFRGESPPPPPPEHTSAQKRAICAGYDSMVAEVIHPRWRRPCLPPEVAAKAIAFLFHRTSNVHEKLENYLVAHRAFEAAVEQNRFIVVSDDEESA